MPPVRRKGSNNHDRTHQSKLSFGTQSKVTKAKPASDNTESSTAKKVRNDVAISPAATEPEPEAHDVEKEEQVTAEEPEAKQQQKEALSEEHQRAERVTDMELRRYWMNEEQKRMVRRGMYSPFFFAFLVQRLTRTSSPGKSLAGGKDITTFRSLQSIRGMHLGPFFNGLC